MFLTYHVGAVIGLENFRICDLKEKAVLGS